MKMLFVLLLLALPGCTSLGAPNLTADQLNAMAKDKNFTAFCLTGAGPTGTGKAVYANVDKSVVVNGAITVAPDCSITMSNEATPKAVAK